MKIEKNQSLWYEAFLDTPLSTPRAGLTEERAFTTPGCFVKTHKPHPELDAKGRVATGRLVSITKDVVIVRSNEPYHDGQGQPFVWSGSALEYAAVWRCD